jgi:hypothetical protein
MGFANAGGVVHVRPLPIFHRYVYIIKTYTHKTYVSLTPLLIHIGHVWCCVRLAVYGRRELRLDHHTVVVGRWLPGRGL